MAQGRTDRVPCVHCGLPARPLVQGDRNLTSQAFCCSGCCLAHHLSADGVTNSADRLLSRVLLSAMLSMAVMMLSLSLYGSMLGQQGDFDSESARALRGLFRLAAMGVSAPVLLLLGLPLAETVGRMRNWFGADALVVMGTTAAWGVSCWNTLVGQGEVYFDTATMVLVLVSLGRWLDLRAKDRARERLQVLLPERAQDVHVVLDDRERLTPAEEVRVGDRVRLRPGEVIPVDGWVRRGHSFVDLANLTGESQPRSVSPGQRVLAGSTLVDGTLEIESCAVGSARVCAEIERLLQEALTNPAPSVRLADRAARALIPSVLLLAVGTAVWHWPAQGPQALLLALSVILIACPCSLGIATPLAFWTALGEAWKHGVLVRGGEVLERLALADRVWLDKTGTLTDGRFELEGVTLHGDLREEEALAVAAALEFNSEHPVGEALRGAFEARRLGGPGAPPVTHFKALPGVGVQGDIDGTPWSLRKGGPGGGVNLLREEEIVAEFHLRSNPREEAGEVLEQLRGMGLDLCMLTGDAPLPAGRLADELGLPLEANLLPADKVARIRAWSPERAVFVGDGLNDAAALAAAGVGISVAGGAARSMDAAPVNLLRPGLGELPGLFRLARRARRVARWNLCWAFGYNGLGLVLAVGGHLPPILAAAAMVASSVAVVLHSSRLKSGRDWTSKAV